MGTADASGRGDHAEDDQEGAVLHVWQTDQPFSGVRMVEGSSKLCQKGVRSGQVGRAVNESAAKFAKELVDRVKREDPARGVWHVKSKGHFRIWCDASAVAVAAALECDGEIVEDGSWLRKRKDPLHINFAELVSVMRGVTLAMRWGVKQLEIMTDSASVYWWLQSLATGDQRLCVSGDGEMLIAGGWS